MPRILFVSNRRASFIALDRDLLAERYRIDDRFETGRIANPLTALRDVLRADLVFGWWASLHTLWPFTWAWLLRKPSVLVVGGFDVAAIPELAYGHQRGGVRRLLARWVMRRARRLVTNSEYSREELRRNVGAREADRVIVVHHGVPDPFGDGVLDGPREALAVTVGGVNRHNFGRKGHRPFVEAGALAPDVRWVLAGRIEDEAAAAELRALAAPNVELTGWLAQEDLEALLRRAAVYVQPSRHEGFGVSVVEAMLAGCVPVVADAGALTEVVGDAGIVLAGVAPEQVAEGVRAGLALGPDGARRARARAVERFPVRVRRDALHAVVERALSESARRAG